MAFYGSRRASGNACYLVYALVLQVEEGDAGSLDVSQRGQCAVQVRVQARVRLAHAALGVYPRRVQVVCLLPAAKIVIILIVRNAVEPGGETGQVLEGSQAGVGTDKGVLRQVVAQFAVAAGQVQEEAPHGRLVFPDQLVEGAVVVEHHDLCNQRYVVELAHSFGLFVSSAAGVSFFSVWSRSSMPPTFM